MTNYADRLNCSLEGSDNYPLFTLPNQQQISTGYTRVVIGERGPYVEFTDTQLLVENFHIPVAELWRPISSLVYYVEYRTNLDKVKIYHQRRKVSYADYVIGKYYISPFDLCDSTGRALITKLQRRKV